MGNSHLGIDFSFIKSALLFIFGGSLIISVVCGVVFLTRAKIIVHGLDDCSSICLDMQIF